MADSLRDKLRALISKHGPALTENVRRCGGMVRDCGGTPRETNLLLAALDEDIPGKLQEQSTGTLDLLLRNRLSQLLQENRGLNEAGAHWAVGKSAKRRSPRQVVRGAAEATILIGRLKK